MKIAPLAIFGIFALLGCGSSSDSAATVSKPVTAEQQSQQIQSDPNMTPEAKAALDAVIKSHQGSGQR